MGRPTDADVIEAIGYLSDLEKPKWSASQIRTMLEALPEYKGRVPASDRAIQGYMKAWREERGKEPWSLNKAKVGSILPVLEALATVMAASKGGIKHVTVKEAEFIVKVREAAPNLDPLISWRVAREYIKRHAEGKPALDLDAYLAIQNLPEDRKAQGQEAFERAFGEFPFMRQIIMVRGIASGEKMGTPTILITTPKQKEQK
jgi:hypothetical protein